MRKRLSTLLLFLLPCAAVHAQQAPASLPELDNYAWGFPIETHEAASLYRVELPLIVNRSSADAELRDAGVYNAAGQAVPRLLQASGDAAEQHESVEALPFAALYRNATPDPERIRLLFEQMGAAVHIDMQSDGAEARKVRAPLSGYIVDLRQLTQPVNALDFTWPAHVDGFIGRMTVAAGDDLETWQPVGGGALADLREDAVAIEQHRIGIAATERDFLRLTFSGMPDDWRLEGITGVTLTQAAQPVRHELALDASGRDAADNGWLFDAGAALRVDRVGIRLAEANSVIKADIYYWQEAQAGWRHLQQAAFHNVRRGDNAVTSPALTVPPLRAARWKVTVVSGRPDTPLQLELGWRPDILTFVAQGAGPYTLGIGREAAAAERYPQQRVFGGMSFDAIAGAAGSVATATLGERVALGGVARALPRAPLQWQTVLLWAGLLAAVLFVALMAVRLLRAS